MDIINKHYYQKDQLQFQQSLIDYSGSTNINDVSLEISVQNTPLRFYGNNLSSSNMREEQENQQTMTKIDKRIKKQKLKKQKKQVIVSIINKCSSIDTLKLSHGLLISSDGLIRFQSYLGQISFGFNFQKISSVTYQKDNLLIQILKQQDQPHNNLSVEDAIGLLARTDCKMFHEASSALVTFSNFKEDILRQIQTIPVNDQLIIEKDIEMDDFLKKSQIYIQQYSSTHECDVFSYAIGRLNIQKRDMEFLNVGYSKSYLDMIGIDVDNFSSILLRHQKVDLVQNKEELMRQSIQGMNLQFMGAEQTNVIYNITTFDGFLLPIQCQKQRIILPNFQHQKLLDICCEYVLQITTIDVELQDLQNLIQYRERLRSNSQELSYEDFIRKELSLMFEDVEYSVHSQTFIEKYYNQNLVKLYEIERLKLKAQNRQQCGYALIENNNSQFIDQ